MKISCLINPIYETLSNLKLNLFCCNKNSVCVVIYTLSDECYLDHKYDNCHNANTISLMIHTLSYIERNTNCCKNYAYLLQIDRLKCIIKNLQKLLCQLKCLQYENCCFYSKVVCSLLKIIELLDTIFSQINNIECLCESHICCNDEIINCILCDLNENINLLEEEVLLLSRIIVEIACQNVINCTPCSTVKCSMVKERDYCDCSDKKLYNNKI